MSTRAMMNPSCWGNPLVMRVLSPVYSAGARQNPLKGRRDSPTSAAHSRFFPGQVCNERRRPSLAAVIGVGFFEVMGVGRNVRPHATYQDRPVIERVRGEKFSAPILESADQGR